MSENIVHIAHPVGHRKAYLDLFVNLTGFKPLIGPVSRQNFLELVSAKKVLFATVGHAFRRFWLVCLLRSITGKTTGVIFLGAMRYRTASNLPTSFFDRFLLKIWKILPKQRLLAITPYNVEPTLAEVTNDYIYDPQMWDLWLENTPVVFPTTPLSTSVERVKKGKNVLIFIGQTTKQKGFEELVKFAEANRATLHVVAAGTVSQECATAVEKLRSLNMTVENRFITDEELLSLYGITDYAWSFYPPEYDQASGIFGRAIQLGVKPVIRTGSVIARTAEQLNIPSIQLEMEDFDNEMTARAALGKGEVLAPLERQQLFIELRDESLEKLQRALR